MKDVMIALAGGLAKKGLARIYWNYNKETDIYEDCVTFYGYERITSTFEKLSRLPANAELDEIEYYDGCCDILLK